MQKQQVKAQNVHRNRQLNKVLYLIVRLYNVIVFSTDH